VKERAKVSNDASIVVQIVSARYGSVPGNTKLSSLRRQNPQLDRFDWLLLVIAIEIDLKVRLPARLIEAEGMTVSEFARAIAALRKVSSRAHTLETVTLLAQALIAETEAGAGSRMRSAQRQAKKWR
jgi:hypothetical protein